MSRSRSPVFQSEDSQQLHTHRQSESHLPGAIIPNDSVNGAAEWAYGVAPWFEHWLYLPVHSLYSTGRHATTNGFKICELFVRPRAHERSFFTAATSSSASTCSTGRRSVYHRCCGPSWVFTRIAWISSTIPSAAFPSGAPIVDTRNLQCVPAGRVSHNLNEKGRGC